MPPRLRLVVADNDPAALDLAVTDLTLEGHDVVAAVLDGASALAACEEHRPDVVVLDHRMPPGPNGLEVAERLSVEQPGLGVVVFTNYQDRELIDAIGAAGALYIPKGSLRRLRRAVLEAAGSLDDSAAAG
ncbi:MAG: ANTAR domain-containing response regulator [Acidimicrobiia bacterium]|jgi:two-component system, LytTR family, response regulator AlgR